MTLAEFQFSLAKKRPPAGISPALAALWWTGKDEWKKAHQIVMDESGKECAWVHAHLHRVEGDLDNARYWYRQAKQRAASAPLRDEWNEIARTLLGGGCSSSS